MQVVFLFESDSLMMKWESCDSMTSIRCVNYYDLIARRMSRPSHHSMQYSYATWWRKLQSNVNSKSNGMIVIQMQLVMQYKF